MDKKKIKKYNKIYYKKNKEKLKKYREEHSKETKQSRLISRYKITQGDYDRLLEKQNKVCAICFRLEKDLYKDGRVKNLAVDHNHRTKRVRGLLCCNCNKALGLFQDNSTILETAIKYLNNYK